MMVEIARVAVGTVARIDAVPITLDVVCRTTGMGFAAVARVTKERWIACSLLDQISFGLAPGASVLQGSRRWRGRCGRRQHVARRLPMAPPGEFDERSLPLT